MALAAVPREELTNPLERRFRGSADYSKEYVVENEKLGEGTFGVVSKARSKKTGKTVALKKILMHNEKDGFPITALREVKLLKMLSHPNILKLDEMAVERPPDDKGKSGKKRATLYMVMPYMEHDLSGILTNPDIKLGIPQIKCYMLQLLEGLRYLHDSHILHRDMKAANILISNSGILQIADFGLARHYEGITPQPGSGNGLAVRDYTSLVVTRWYRPPELLLTLKRYTPAIDMWGVGCIFGEVFERRPILEGKSDLDQCFRIFKLVGSPNEERMPGWSSLPGIDGKKDWPPESGDIEQRFGRHLGREGLDLLKQLLSLDYRRRINAIDALQHPFFKVEPYPARPEDLPRYNDSHELDARRRGQEKQRALPPAPAGGTVGMGPDEWNGQGGHYGNGYYNDRRRPNDYRGQPPPGRYDDRGRGPPPAQGGPQWRQDAARERDRRGPVPTNGHPLPPRPDGHVLPPRPGDVAPLRGPPPTGGAPPRGGPGGGGGNVDTYIPNYDRRDDAGGRRRDDGHRGGQGGGYRDADAPPRGNYRDGDNGSSRDPYRAGGYDGQRRTRSRSPERADQRRARLQDRERDLYRR